MNENFVWTSFKKGVAEMQRPNQLSRVESHATAIGIPDVVGCVDGVEFFLELKHARKEQKFELRPAQNSWMYNRTKAGGRCWILAMYENQSHFEWYLIDGHHCRDLVANGDPKFWKSLATTDITAKTCPSGTIVGSIKLEQEGI